MIIKDHIYNNIHVINRKNESLNLRKEKETRFDMF